MLETVEAAAEVFVTHTTNKDNPHKVTKEQVGLGSVDNTSDMDKPVSNAAAEAIEALKEECLSATETLGVETQSAITTLRSETFSAIAALKEECLSATETLGVETQSAIKTLWYGTLTLGAETQSAINTFKEENNREHTDIYSAINTFKAESSVEFTEINSIIDTLRADISQAEQLIAGKADSSHNHNYLVSRPNCIEFLPTGTSKHGGFLDFHYKRSTADYTSRIIEDASGKISVIANNGFFVNGLAVNTAPRVTVADGVTWIETPLSNGKSMLYGMAVKSGNGDGFASGFWKMVPPKSIDNTTVKFTANALAEDNNNENRFYEEWSVLTYDNLAAGSYKNIVVVKGDIKATKFLLTMQAITK